MKSLMHLRASILPPVLGQRAARIRPSTGVQRIPSSETEIARFLDGEGSGAHPAIRPPEGKSVFSPTPGRPRTVRALLSREEISGPPREAPRTVVWFGSGLSQLGRLRASTPGDSRPDPSEDPRRLLDCGPGLLLVDRFMGVLGCMFCRQNISHLTQKFGDSRNRQTPEQGERLYVILSPGPQSQLMNRQTIGRSDDAVNRG